MGDFDGAIDAWRQCVRRQPSYTQGLAFLGLGYYWRREYDSAAVFADSSVNIDPGYLLGRTTAGFIEIERGNYARGEAAYDAARRLNTDVEVVNTLAGAALAEARAGHTPRARATLRNAETLAAAYSPTPLHTATTLAAAYAALGDADRATEWLARYSPVEDLHFQLHLRCDPPFDPIKADPRFKALLLRPTPPSGRGC
jgi:tetratricopeptide (TPR) repeat protein